MHPFSQKQWVSCQGSNTQPVAAEAGTEAGHAIQWAKAPQLHTYTACVITDAPKTPRSHIDFNMNFMMITLWSALYFVFNTLCKI